LRARFLLAIAASDFLNVQEMVAAPERHQRSGFQGICLEICTPSKSDNEILWLARKKTLVQDQALATDAAAPDAVRKLLSHAISKPLLKWLPLVVFRRKLYVAPCCSKEANEASEFVRRLFGPSMLDP
jgi:hypothetical protein